MTIRIGWITGVAAAALVAACSSDDSNAQECPDETTVGSGASCSTDQQSCIGSVDVGSCPGAAAQIQELDCTCTDGKWQCQPSAPSCAPDAAGDAAEAGDAAGVDGGASDAPDVGASNDAEDGGDLASPEAGDAAAGG